MEKKEHNITFVELPYQKIKRKYWCKIIISELKKGRTLNMAFDTANRFLNEYDKTFGAPADSSITPPKSNFYI